MEKFLTDFYRSVFKELLPVFHFVNSYRLFGGNELYCKYLIIVTGFGISLIRFISDL